MIFWDDAQLPPTLADWLSSRFGVEARSLRDLGLHDAADVEIFDAAQRANAVIVSKDSDFVRLVKHRGAPPQLLWVTCGNVTNGRLQAVFDRTFADALAALVAGKAIVKIG